MADRPLSPACRSGLDSACELLDGATIDGLVRSLKAVADPVRLQILLAMTRSTGEACSCEFEPLFDVSQPTISHHLKVLRQAGLISGRQDGTWVRYSVQPSAMARLAALLESLAQPDTS